MTLITILSAAGMALGLGGIIPQIIRMARARSAAGQSPAGWVMCLAANSALAYVNITAFGAFVLATSNIVAALLSGVAAILVWRRAPFLVIVLAAAATAALLRAV